MEKNRSVIIIGELTFPQMCASSIRVYGIAKACKLIGLSPIIISRGNLSTDSEFDLSFIEVNSFLSLKHKMSYKKQYQSLLNNYVNKDIAAVILYGNSSARFFNTVYNWCKEKNIKLIVNIGENYSYKQFKHGFLNKNYWLFKYNFYFNLKKNNTFITCSDMASDFFKSKNTVKINAVMDVFTNNQKKLNKDITILYAGDAGKKDKLNPIIRAVCQYNLEYERKIYLKILGPSKEIINKKIQSLKNCKESAKYIIPFGNVTREEVLKQTELADFTILVRPNERYANFGFPSKVAESLCLSTPIIANITSDLGYFLVENKCGIQIKGSSFEDIYNSLKTINVLDQNTYSEMVNNCINVSNLFKPETIASREDFRRLFND